MSTDLRAIGPRFVLEEFFYKHCSRHRPGKTRLIDGAVLSDVSNVVLNGEADLDFQIAISLGRLSPVLPPCNKLMPILRVVYPQKVTLYQVGDPTEGASFNNFLDALDASYCTSVGSDVLNV
jgi:tripeptidyl-peptidase-1